MIISKGLNIAFDESRSLYHFVFGQFYRCSPTPVLSQWGEIMDPYLINCRRITPKCRVVAFQNLRILLRIVRVVSKGDIHLLFWYLHDVNYNTELLLLIIYGLWKYIKITIPYITKTDLNLCQMFSKYVNVLTCSQILRPYITFVLEEVFGYLS